MNGLTYCQIVAKEIKRIRNMKNLTLKKLSELSHIPASTIHRLEAGNQDFRTTTLIRLCRGLEIEFVDFLKITDAEYDKQKRHP